MNEDNNWCFVCGIENPCGLKVKFCWQNDEYAANFLPQKEHQGYNGLVHGGIIATLLDEAIGAYVYEKTGKLAVTARMDLRYREAVPVGKPVKVVGRLIKQKGRLYEMKGELFLADGTLAAEATGKVLLAE